MPFDHQAFLKQLTQRPGVYQMLSESGEVLYVGKAKNLRKRVSSYFRKTGLSPKTAALVQRIASIQVTVTETEVEALLLEQNMIKQGRPPYNILLRDDKSYPYVFLSDKDTFPRLAVHRGVKRLKGRYFGPYPNVQAVRESLNFLQKVFQVRQCEDSFFNNRSRPCLQYQIKRCTAPCVGKVTQDEYRDDVRHTQMFLEGKSDALIRELELSMDQAANLQNYEKAALLRDQLISLRKVQAEQVIEGGRGNIDVLAGAIAENVGCVHLLYIRQGRIIGSRNFYPKLPLAADVAEMLEEFIPRFYMSASSKEVPAELITSVELANNGVLAEALTEYSGHQVKLKREVRTNRAKWLELSIRTAEQNLAGHLAAKQNLWQRFETLKEELQLENLPERIECFDISHSGGEATVASCVVFDTNGPLKSDYRRFNIEGITAGDDYAAMEQALTRRYTRLQKGEGKLPEILLIDGGLGQLGKATSVLAELGVIDVLVLGVAKGYTRKPGFETLVWPDGKTLELPPTSPGLLLIQQIRDEAHRFAITGHRQRRDKKRRTSTLEGIDGVGPKRRRELLRFFGGYKEVERAGVAELMRVPNINKKVAEAIYSALHNE